MNKLNLSTFETFKHLQSDHSVTINDEELSKMQGMLTDMLKDIITVCEDNGFYYVLGGGSALGAIRHQGFIPWDDDIDLNLRRKDVDAFIRVMNEKFSDRYWIHSPQTTDNYGLTFLQVRKKGTSVKTRDDYWNEECGLCIDLFPIENTYDNPLMRFLHKSGCYYYGFMVSCRKFFRDRKWMMFLAGDDRSLKLVFSLKIAFGFLGSWRSLDNWVRKADRWYSRCHDENSKDIVIPSGRNHFKELYPRQIICTCIKKPFGALKAAVPAGYDFYLKKMYGDYMKIPAHGNEEKHVYYKPFYLDKQTEADA